MEENAIYLAWLPLSIMMSVIMLFGRRGILPLVLGFALTNNWLLNLPSAQSAVLLFCQLFGVFLTCAILRWRLGKRWRFGFPRQHLSAYIFWTGFFAPLVMKSTMYLAGHYFDFPLSISTYFGSASVLYSVIDVQSLICSALIFNVMFYYALRMLLNPRFARAFWRRNVHAACQRQNRLFTPCWGTGLVLILFILCSPYESEFISGYLVPVVFILFFIAISRFTMQLVSLLWAASAFILVIYNKNFLYGVSNEFALSFVLSVLISFTISLLYMAAINARNNLIQDKWQRQALLDPLTGLPNIRALECYLAHHSQLNVCCLRMDNLEFLSRHYGMMMRVHCKRIITLDLQPLLECNERVFQLPGSELLLVLNDTQTTERLSGIVNALNSRQYHWQSNELGLEFGASWGHIDVERVDFHQRIGQLSWLSEQACRTRCVQTLDHSLATVTDNTTDRVLQLNRIKRALNDKGVLLYAQPIVDSDGEQYHEILTRLTCDGVMMMPDQFIPLIAQFNLSQIFDMQVLERLFQTMGAFPGAHFSVNLMPFTLMQKEGAAEIIRLFRRYGIAPQSIIIEITEEQAFSNSEVSLHNIRQLREFGCRIAIDDFGTGYANYERLKCLQADIIKIDGCFVRDIETDELDAIMVKSICEMAKVKNLSVVAEFVETQEQKTLLLTLGVDYLQGYLIGKPQPLAESGTKKSREVPASVLLLE